MILFFIAAMALVLGIVLLRRSQRRRQQLGLPNGDVGDEAARKVLPKNENLAWLAEVVDQVRRARELRDIGRSHHQRSRCRGYGLKHSCDQSLDKAK